MPLRAPVRGENEVAPHTHCPYFLDGARCPLQAEEGLCSRGRMDSFTHSPHRWGDRGPKRAGDLPRVTQMVRSKARVLPGQPLLPEQWETGKWPCIQGLGWRLRRASRGLQGWRSKGSKAVAAPVVGFVLRKTLPGYSVASGQERARAAGRNQGWQILHNK